MSRRSSSRWGSSVTDRDDAFLPEDLGYGECIRETHKSDGKPGALLIKFETGRETWIPRSVIHDNSEVWKEGQDGEVTVVAWWAEKNA